jgi:hypothetical protein
MSYVWGAQGPAFEYPTCYRIENRFLALRAVTLVLIAMTLLWVVLSEPAGAESSLSALKKVERGAAWPHVLIALFMLLLGLLDGIRASRQRKVFLGEGQPASLVREIRHGASGWSREAAALLRALDHGARGAGDGRVKERGRGLMSRIAPTGVATPPDLLQYIRVRAANAVFAMGCLVVLGVWSIFGRGGPELPLAAVFLAILVLAWLSYAKWIASEVPSTRVVVVMWIVAAAVGASILAFGGRLPHVQLLTGWALPIGVATLLASVTVGEALAMLAGRSQIDRPSPPAGAVPAARSAQAVDPVRAMREIDAELVRRCVDGVPNRRYLRRNPDVPADSDEERALPLILEETQPGLPRSSEARLPMPTMSRIAALLVLGVLGIALSATGGLAWTRMAYALVQDASTPWAPAGTALALLVVGGYIIRLGHHAWSRIEVESSVYAVDLPAGEVTVRVWRVRSVFFAAGNQGLGSRRLLRATPDPSAAQQFVQQVLAFALRPMAAAPAAGAPQARRDPSDAGNALPRVPARFCSTCGTPLLAGARFCQQCGAGLTG